MVRGCTCSLPFGACAAISNGGIDGSPGLSVRRIRTSLLIPAYVLDSVFTIPRTERPLWPACSPLPLFRQASKLAVSSASKWSSSGQVDRHLPDEFSIKTCVERSLTVGFDLIRQIFKLERYAGRQQCLCGQTALAKDSISGYSTQWLGTARSVGTTISWILISRRNCGHLVSDSGTFSNREGETPGDLHLRLNELAVWPDRPAKPWASWF